MRPLTEKQEQTLSYIRTYVRKHGHLHATFAIPLSVVQGRNESLGPWRARGLNRPYMRYDQKTSYGSLVYMH